MIKIKISNIDPWFSLVPACLLLLALYYLVHRDLLVSAFLILLVLNFRRIEGILDFFKLKPKWPVFGSQLTLIIFADGAVRIESGTEGRIAGYLDSNHWCTRFLAVVRVVSGGKTHHLLALSARQDKPDDFRRLNLWLRQKIYPGAGRDPA
jgi:hypothetical protein